jgi:hypothetical protein
MACSSFRDIAKNAAIEARRIFDDATPERRLNALTERMAERSAPAISDGLKMLTEGVGGERYKHLLKR